MEAVKWIGEKMSIVLEHVSKTFISEKGHTLKDISFEIRDGEFICLLGHSGSGKSTLLNLIAGLEKPTQGTITFDGRTVEKPWKECAVMFQEPALFPWLKVIDNVTFGLKLQGISKQEQEETAKKYLAMVRLGDCQKKAVHELSGGMKQRVAMARALAMNSGVLLMDEPFSALDKQTRNQLRDEIYSIWVKTGKTIVFVTHSVEEAVFFADRIIMLAQGEIVRNMEVNLPRPRDISSPAFLSLRKELLCQLRNEEEKLGT